MKINLLLSVILLFVACTALSGQEKSFHDFTVTTIDGEELALSAFAGKKVMVVNVASECGLTPQYVQLQAVYEKYGTGDFAIVAFPANNFGEQEKGTDSEIKTFCDENYGVTFPMMSKISVSGEDIHPLYLWLTTAAGNGVQDAPVIWNFQKFLIDEHGRWVRSVDPRILPDDKSITDWIEVE